MEEMDARTLEKIQKLLALTSSSNENEAASALRAASTLAEKYGADILTLKRKFVNEFSDIPLVCGTRPYEVLLGEHVASFCGCMIYTKSKRVYVWGEQPNVNLFSAIFYGLIEQINNAMVTMKAGDKYIGMGGPEKKSYHAMFKNGLLVGIKSTIDELSPRGALMVPYKEVLVSRFKSAHPECVYKKIKYKLHTDGMIIGKTFKLAPEIK